MKVAVTIIILAFAVNVHAYQISNMYGGGYPSHNCDKPSKPFEPFSDDEDEQEEYKREMEIYEDNLDDFEDCLYDYVTAAERDIETINDAIWDAKIESKRMF